ncbi:hypothetical protein EU522_00780 [Candidatus Thorarchaeota archaeon]|nr:MAG: hypothetical protein EU522_00780 [Candidatus Thorarchaeota archaeon]
MVLGQEEKQADCSIKIIRGCPCYKVFGDEKLCVNDDRVLEIDAIELDPALFAFHRDKESMKEEKAAEDNVCYTSIYINYPDNRVYCISQGWKIRIHNRDVLGADLQDALQFLSTKDLTASAEICSECLYKFLLTLSDQFADTMTRKEKTDEVKRYVDKFSLMIAVKHSQMDSMMKPIGTEDEIDKGVDHFQFLREYLVQLIEQQETWGELMREFPAEEDKWLREIVEKRVLLARLEYQFYSQTLQLRDINDFNLLIKNLQYILKTSNEILTINEVIHDQIRSDKFKEKAKDDKRLKALESYSEKARTVEHNFGNILQILSRL